MLGGQQRCTWRTTQSFHLMRCRQILAVLLAIWFRLAYLSVAFQGISRFVVQRTTRTTVVRIPSRPQNVRIQYEGDIIGTTCTIGCSRQISRTLDSHQLRLSTINNDESTNPVDARAVQNQDALAPQVFASGYSTKANLVEALREAVQVATQALPPAIEKGTDGIDLAIVSVSSLYDGGVQKPATMVVPVVLEAVKEFYNGTPIQHLVGSSVAGCISSSCSYSAPKQSSDAAAPTATKTVELEGIPSVSVTLALLPGVQLRTFDCGKDDLFDDVGRLPATEWKRPLGLQGFAETTDKDDQNDKPSEPVFLLLPSPAFSAEVDNLLYGLSFYFPGWYV